MLRFIQATLKRYQRDFDHTAVRFILLGWVGVVGLPLFYVVWSLWYPQEYESLWLRAIGVLLCVPGVVLPRILKSRWREVYLFASVTYVLPFFFTFMYLKNHGNPVWSQSVLVAVLLLFQFDTMWALVCSIVGVSLAAGVFALSTGELAFMGSLAVLRQLPVYAFIVVAISIARVGRRMLEQEKLDGMAQGLATVSHELRTPLVSVEANVRGMQRLLGRAETGHLDEALARIQYEVRHMHSMVDLFLLSATAVREKLEPDAELSMREMVEAATLRFPFDSGGERGKLAIDVRADFRFAGQHDLAVVILLNLLRNALKAVRRAGKGRIRIIVDGGHAVPRLLFIDTGCGVPPQHLPQLFKRFFSHPAGTGTGIGLALCKEILESWQASIRCVSRETAYTVFVLEFPAAARAA